MANTISLAPFDRKDYITRTQKYNRYKIVNYKRFAKRKPGVPRNGSAVFAYDKGDKLSIVRMHYNTYLQSNGDPFFNSNKPVVLVLKVKDSHLIVWQCKNSPQGAMSKIRNISCHAPQIKKELFVFGVKNIYGGALPPFPSDELEELDTVRTIPPIIKSIDREFQVVSKRLNRVLIHFLKRNNIKIKPSKDFFENVRKACYPQSAPFKLNEQWLNPAFSRHFLHGDLDYVIEQCFGHKDQKLSDMVKARIEKDKSFDALLIGCLLQKYLPLDYFYKALDANLDRLSMAGKVWSFKISDVRRLFKRYNPDIILRLILAEDFKDFHFTNTIHLLHQFKNPAVEFPPDPKNWQDLHNSLEQYRQKMVGKGLIP